MKNHKLTVIYLFVLILFTVYVVLDTFVFSSIYKVANSKKIKKDTGEVTSSDDSYSDDNIKINIKEYKENDTTIYVADIILKDNSLLKTGFANDSYGKNITETTSDIAESAGAVLAINGDYYGVQQSGYVLKSGIIYRSTSSSNEDLVIYKDGSFEIINEDDVSLEELVSKGAYNILSFGPALVYDGKVAVSKNSEVGRAMASNPRTAIGVIEDGHYVFVVSDGRTSESKGLSLYELATFMGNLGCDISYNLDGGGSSTMYFNGKVINNTVGGRGSSERKVSDIVYIGY